MNTILLDLRYSLRTLRKSPSFAVAAILSLAIGIGATAAVFSIANALLLRPLPYEDPDRLVILWNRSPGLGITEDWFSTAQYFDIKNGHHGLEQVAIAIGANYNLTGKGEPERVGTIRVSSNLLPMLGMHAATRATLRRRRRPAGANAHRIAQLWHVVAALRFRPGDSRQDDHAEWHALRSGRSDAALVLASARSDAYPRRRRTG